jgi:hypothetical protein
MQAMERLNLNETVTIQTTREICYKSVLWMGENCVEAK